MPRQSPTGRSANRLEPNTDGSQIQTQNCLVEKGIQKDLILERENRAKPRAKSQPLTGTACEWFSERLGAILLSGPRS